MTQNSPDYILQLQQTIATLEKQVSQFNRALHMVSVGFWYWVPQKDEIQWSDEIYRMLELPPGSVTPNSAYFMSRIHPDDVTFVASHLQTVMSAGVAPDMKYRLITNSNNTIHVLARAHVVKSQSGAPDYVFGTVQDISETVRQETALVEAKVIAEQSLQSKSEFLSSMTHELRTPMNAILGFAQVLENDSLTVEQQENAQEIIRAGRHLLNLTSDILDLSLADSGNMKFHAQEINLANLLDEICALLKPLAYKYDVAVEHGDLKSTAPVFADEMRLKQVIINLISNAIKYNRKGGKVRIVGEQTNVTYARLRVTDTGFGIHPDDLNRIFMPFERAQHNRGAIEGTGIGLAICKRFMEVMGGSIGVESKIDVGSEFWIDIPLYSKDSSN